jgi:hypothetical protein
VPALLRSTPWHRDKPPPGYGPDPGGPVRRPAAYFLLNEAGGTPRDLTGGLAPATLEGNAAWTACVGGSGLVLAGGSDSAKFAAAPSVNNLAAFSYWARILYDNDQSGGEGAVVSKCNDFETTKVLTVGASFPSHQLVGRVAASTTAAFSAPSAAALTLNTVCTVCMTYDDGGDRKIRLYANGLEVAYGTQTAAAGTMTADTSAPVRMGGRGVSGISSAFTGKVLAAGVWPVALSLPEIWLLHCSPYAFLSPPARRRAVGAAAASTFKAAWAGPTTSVVGAGVY